MTSLSGAHKFREDIDIFLRSLKIRDLDPEAVPTFSTLVSGRFTPALGIYMANQKGLLGKVPEGFVDKITYALFLSKMLDDVGGGRVTNSGDFLDALPRRDVSGKPRESVIFDVLSAGLQNYAYFNDNTSREIFLLSASLAYSSFETLRKLSKLIHVRHFMVHAAVFMSSAEQHEKWSDLFEKTVLKLESWAEPSPPVSFIVHAATNLGISADNFPEEDPSYETVKDLRLKVRKKEMKKEDAFGELNSMLGWAEASEILRIIWQEEYKSYYRYNRDIASRIRREKGTSKALDWCKKYSFTSPMKVPYIKVEKSRSVLEQSFLSFPGGSSIGHTSVMFKSGNSRLLFDHGCDQFGRLPVWSPDTDMIDAVFVTHAHHDHIGGLLKLYVVEGYRGPWYALAETGPLAELAMEDLVKINTSTVGRSSVFSRSDVKRVMKKFCGLSPGERVPTEGGISVKTFHAGHVHGSCQYLIDSRDISVMYTGDFNPQRTFSVKGMTAPSDAESQRVRALITEGTYAFRKGEGIIDSHAARRDLLREIKSSSVFPVLLPVLSLGRAQEVLAGLSGTKYKVGVFGLAMKMTMATGAKYQDNIIFADDNTRLERVSRKEYDVIVASSGCLQGGPSKFFYGRNGWGEMRTILTGYIFPGTPAGKLTDVLPRIRYSAHATHEDWLAYLKRFPNADVYLIHYPGERRDTGSENIIVPQYHKEYILTSC